MNLPVSVLLSVYQEFLLSYMFVAILCHFFFFFLLSPATKQRNLYLAGKTKCTPDCWWESNTAVE